MLYKSDMDLTMGERVIALIDMDCFYVQVEQKLCPEYENKPCSVVQYQQWKGGGIIAVNYEARAFGVNRGMRGDDAKALCPDIHNFRVPEVRNKADLTRYREAGASVIDVLSEYCDCVERASVDEAYLDMTAMVNNKLKNSALEICLSQISNTFVVGWDKDSEGDDVQSWLDSTIDDHMFNDRKLAIAALLVEEIRAAVYTKTKFRCSAGIAHNKMLAKLACGLHKPNRQTVLPQASVPIFFDTLPLHKVRNLGGKFGNEVKEKLNVSNMGDLMKYSESQFQSTFGEKPGSWLYLISRGLDHEVVVSRQLPKSVGCGKNFNGNNILDTKSKVSHWLLQLSIELDERLQKDQLDNRRFARSLTVSVRSKDDHEITTNVSRTCPIYVYNAQKFANDAYKVIQKLNVAPVTSLFWKPPLTNLTLAASKFEDQIYSPSHNIHSYFASNCNNENLKDDSYMNASSPITNIKRKSQENHMQQKDSKKIGTINCYFSKSNNSSGECNDEEVSDVEDILDDVLIMVNDTTEQNYDSVSVDESRVHNETVQNEDLSTCDKPLNSFFAKRFDKRNEIECHETSFEGKCDIFSPNNISKSELFFNNKQDILDVSTINALHCNDEKRLPSPEKINENSNKNNHDLQSISSSSTNSQLPSSAVVDLTASTSNSISKAVQSENDLPDELLIICKKCNKKLPVWIEQEHSDFHLAMDIQCESHSNIKTTIFSNSKSSNVTKKDVAQRNSRKVGISKGRKLKKQNTIDMFLK